VEKYQIYGIGSALVDTEVAVSHEFLRYNDIETGVRTLVDEERQAGLINSLTLKKHLFTKMPGGSVCNSLVAAASLGAKTFFAGKVASDDDGLYFIDSITKSGVAFHTVSPAAGVTGKCLVMVTPDAERSMVTYLGASDSLTNRDINEEALYNSEWLCVEGYLLTDTARAWMIKDLVLKAQESGVRVALTLSDPRVVQIFADNLRLVIGGGIDMLFCNRDEALAFSGRESIDEAFEVLRQCVKNFVVTDGAAGIYVFNGEIVFKVPGCSADAIDTNGAGDMVAGAFLYAVTKGRDMKWAAELANELAARVVEQLGPRLDVLAFDAIKLKFGI
jgi:sugar/nucleoside kinase (ribokinase family)